MTRLLTFAVLLAVLAAPAAEISGVSFPDQLAIGDAAVPLRGTAVMKWKRMIKVHASATWLPTGQTEAIVALRPRIDRFNALYQDIKEGQRYRLTYRPGVGTELAKDGTPLGTIEGADFAQAIFGIWLGPKAIDDDFRDRVLGR